MIEFHKGCNNQLPRGLYIGYVKFNVPSVDSMAVLVDKSQPNILPYIKVRDNPHISRKEWAALKLCLRPETIEKANSGSSSSLIHSSLSTSASQLYLASFQKEKEREKEKEKEATTATTTSEGAKDGSGGGSQNATTLFGPFLTTTPTSPAQQHNSHSSANNRDTQSSSTTQSLFSQFFELACSNLNVNNGMPSSLSRCSSSASSKMLDDKVSYIATNNNNNNDNNNTNKTAQQRNITFTERQCVQQLLKFLANLLESAGHFLQSLGITDAEHSDWHRLYSIEAIELTPEVSFILLLPPVDEVFSINMANNDLLQVSNLNYLPLKTFELSKYLRDFYDFTIDLNFLTMITF